MDSRRGLSATSTPSQQPGTPYDSDEGAFVADTPAVLISPVKTRKCRQDVFNKSDKEVWELSDEEIIGVWLYNS